MSNSSFETRTEELFLRIFKWVLLAVMALSLAVALVFGGLALANFLKSEPGSASSPRSAAGQTKLDDYLKSLEAKEPVAEDKPAKPEAPAPKGSHFKTQAEEIIACSKESLKFTHAELVEHQDWPKITQDEAEWLDVQGSQEGWGEAWVNEQRDIICAASKSQKLRELFKADKAPALVDYFLHDVVGDSHTKAWAEFLEAERERTAQEQAESEFEAAKASVKVVTQATVAGVAFGLFMLIALYLIFAKIETNLRIQRP